MRSRVAPAPTVANRAEAQAGRNGSTGTGKAEARRGTSGGGPRSADLRRRLISGALIHGVHPGRSGDGRADQGRADTGLTDGGSGGQPDVRDPAGAEAGSGGSVAVVSRLVPRDNAGGAATPAIDETSVGSVHPLADLPRRRPAAGGAEPAQPESDQWFASNTDIAEAAAPHGRDDPGTAGPRTRNPPPRRRRVAARPLRQGRL